MKRLVFLCSTVAAALAIRLPLGGALAGDSTRAARALASQHGGGHCANHRRATRWSGYAMRDMFG
jgi:hypothetical protein